MKVKMILEPGQPIKEVDDNYGLRLIENGRAVLVTDDTPVTPVEPDRSPVDLRLEALEDAVIPVNLYKGALEDGAIDSTDGQVADAEGWKHTGYASVEDMLMVVYTGVKTCNSDVQDFGAAFYSDRDEESYISGDAVQYSSGSDPDEANVRICIVPSGAKYARFSWKPALGDFAMYEAHQWEDCYTQHIKTAKGCLPKTDWPSNPSTNGTYTLKLVKSGSGISMSWVADE